MYFGVSTTITMMAPYFSLDKKAPFAELFGRIGWTISKYVVSFGAICALTTSLLGSMFPLPRVVLAMARDGLVFKIFANINKHLKTPTIATIFTGILAAILAGVFDVYALVEMMSIGTLLAYTLVAASVLILRYDAGPEDVEMARLESENQIKSINSPVLEKTDSTEAHSSIKTLAGKILHPSSKYPTTFSSKVVKILFSALLFWLLIICILMKYFSEQIFYDLNFLAVLPLGFSVAIACGTMYLISLQPQSCKALFFKVPAVYAFPALSIAINIFLMLNLTLVTWVRFMVWMAMGLLIYFGYGIKHSSEEKAYLNPSSKIDETMEAECGTIHLPQPSQGDIQSVSGHTKFVEVKL
uniref:Cationic amino acid transporter C-terminal domain-containing protein n=1 Tax=Romanomermis culicivorax TaxID=13658 RepID=A0A915L388_ROMCU